MTQENIIQLYNRVNSKLKPRQIHSQATLEAWSVLCVAGNAFPVTWSVKWTVTFWITHNLNPKLEIVRFLKFNYKYQLLKYFNADQHKT